MTPARDQRLLVPGGYVQTSTVVRKRGSTNAKAKQRKMALRRAQYAEIREIDRTIQLDSLAILEEVMRHFFLEGADFGGHGD